MELELKQSVREKAAKIPVRKVAGAGGTVFFKIFRLLFLAGISYLMLYPVLTMLSVALSDPMTLMGDETVWIPRNATFKNFTNVLDYFEYWDHAKITIQKSVISTAITLLVCPLVGYGLARHRFPGNGLIFGMVILTIVVPIQVAQVPMYLEYQSFDFFGIGTLIGTVTGKPLTVDLLDTNWIFYLPAMFGMGLYSGLYIFLFRQFFKGMPKDLEDAGRVDGCSRLGIYAKIILPNVKPVFVTVLLLSMINYWNETLISNMLIVDANKQPLMVYAEQISRILHSQSSSLGHINSLESKAQSMAAVLMVSGPLMLLFLVCQKFFVESMDRSGIKG